jgi:hypothetical protein
MRRFFPPKLTPNSGYFRRILATGTLKKGFPPAREDCADIRWGKTARLFDQNQGVTAGHGAWFVAKQECLSTEDRAKQPRPLVAPDRQNLANGPDLELALSC